MCNQLIRIGVNSNRILLGINILPYYNFGEKILESNGKMIVTKKGVEYEYRNIKYKMETKQQVKDTTRIVAKMK